MEATYVNGNEKEALMRASILPPILYFFILSFLAAGADMAQPLPCLPRSSYHLRLDQFAVPPTDVQFGSPTHGQVLLNVGNGSFNAVEYEIPSDCDATYRLDLKAAALDERPVRIKLNDRVVQENAVAGTTGGWGPPNQRWFEAQATLPLTKGNNRLRIERDGVFPHISELELVLCRRPDSCYDFDITGIWSASEETGKQYQFFQQGGEFTGVYVNSVYSHLISGKFTSASGATGSFEHRRDRRDGCDTRIRFDIEFKSNDKFIMHATFPESKCGLQAGGTADWTFVRIL